MATTKKKVQAEEVEEVKNEVEEEVVEESAAMKTTVNGDEASSEGFNLDDFIEGAELTLSQIPTLKLIQALTPEVTSGEYPDIRPGMFIDDVTKEVIGTDVEFRLVMMWRQRVKFPPRESGQTAIECSCPTVSKGAVGDIGTTYGHCKTCNFYNFDSKEHCNAQYTLVVALDNDPNKLYRIIVSRTSASAGKNFSDAFATQYNRFAKYRLPLFMFRGVLSAKKAKNNKINATYFVNELKVIPETEVPTMEESLKAEFIERYKEIRTLRQNQIDTGLAIAKDNMAKRGAERADSEEFNELNSNLAADMGLEEGAPTTDKTPF